MRVLVLLLTVMACTSTRARPVAPTLRAAVGLQVITLDDRARTDDVAPPPPTLDGRTPQPRRVRLVVWYPALAPADAAGLTLRELIGRETVDAVAERDLAATWRRWGGPELSSPQLAGLLDARVDAVADAAPRRGPTPVVVLASSLPPSGHAALAARLVRRGLIVVALGRPDERDLALTLNALDRVPGADPSRVALVAYGGGGRAAVLTQLQTRVVRAVVSLDGNETHGYRIERLRDAPSYRPRFAAVPYLHVVPATRADRDLGFYDAAPHVALTRVEIAAIPASPYFAPLALSSYPAIAAATSITPGAAEVDLAALHDALADRVAGFLAAALLDEPDPRSPIAGATITERAARPRPVVVPDGVLDEPIWATARAVAVAAGTTALVAADADHLYVAYRWDAPATRTTELLLASGGGASWWLHSSNSLCDARGLVADYVTCGRVTGWWWASNSMSADATAVEYYVARDELGAAPIHASFVVGDDLGPAGAQRDDPRTWPPLLPP